MNKGFVYILTNPSMPGLVKIGKTTRDIEQRVKELSSATGVPSSFDIFGYEFTPDCHLLERVMHEELCDKRVSECREFFKVDSHDAANMLHDANLQLVSQFVEEFAPGYVVSYEPMTVRDFDVSTVSSRIGADPYDVAAALANVQGDELHSALRRMDLQQKPRREKSRLHVVSG